MRGLILAAGYGTRLQPYTNHFPKPLLRLDGVSLIQRQIDQLRAAGVVELCINLHWLGEQIHAELRHLPAIRWQWEDPILNTGGAITRALPWLCEHDQMFVLANGDIFHNFDLRQLVEPRDATLVLVPTKQAGKGQKGDFGCVKGRVQQGDNSYVYGGLARLNGAMFAACDQGECARAFPLAKVLHAQIPGGIGALIHRGVWEDLGTPQRCAPYAARLTNPEGTLIFSGDEGGL